MTQITRADLLAVERTQLANERTFLAYFRTSAALLTSGLAIQQIEFFMPMRHFSPVLLATAPVFLAIGAWRFFVVRRRVGGIARGTSPLTQH